MNAFIKSIGNGKIIVEFFSVDIPVNVCKYLSCRALGESDITSEASLRAFEAFISPSAVHATNWNKYNVEF